MMSNFLLKPWHLGYYVLRLCILFRSVFTGFLWHCGWRCGGGSGSELSHYCHVGWKSRSLTWPLLIPKEGVSFLLLGVGRSARLPLIAPPCGGVRVPQCYSSRGLATPARLRGSWLPTRSPRYHPCSLLLLCGDESPASPHGLCWHWGGACDYWVVNESFSSLLSLLRPHPGVGGREGGAGWLGHVSA